MRSARILYLCTVLATGCATPYSPTRVLPKSTATLGIDPSSGLVYDELLSDSAITLSKEGQIIAVTPEWAKKALGRVLDLQEALDNCEAERRQLIPQ